MRRASIRSMFPVYIALTISLSGCVSISTPVSSTNTLLHPTSTPASTSTPAKTDLITTSGFQFQISKATIDDTVKIIGPATSAENAADGHPITAHKGGLVFTPGGLVPVNAAGDAVLILDIKLISGDMQKFLGLEPKIIEAGVEKSAVEVLSDDVLREFYWIYDVNRSSHFSFYLKLPDNTILDLKPIMERFNPLAIPAP